MISEEMKNGAVKIGFIGAGKMATALIKGLLKEGVPAEAISAGRRHASPATESLEASGVFVTADNCEAAARSDIIVLSVKPKDLPAVLAELSSEKMKHYASPEAMSKKLFISIAAGVTTERIESSLAPSLSSSISSFLSSSDSTAPGISKARVIRVMPNICATVSESASALAAGKNATPEDMKAALDIFSSIGKALETKENLIDAVTGLSGSGPAFIFQIIEAMADGGVAAGLDRKTAQTLAAQTVLGSAKMVLETGEHPGVLKDMVCSPAGTTIEGVRTLEEAGIRAAFMNAVISAAERSAELGRKSA